MIVVMKEGASQPELDAVVNRVREMGLKEHVIVGTERTVAARVSSARAVPPAPAASAGAPVSVVAAPGLSAVRSVITVHFWSISLAHPADSLNNGPPWLVAARPRALRDEGHPWGWPGPSSLASDGTSTSLTEPSILIGRSTPVRQDWSPCHYASTK